MKFNEWINDKNYENLNKRGHTTLLRIRGFNQQEREDIISEAIQFCIKSNETISESGKFINGYFNNVVRNRGIAYLANKNKRNTILVEKFKEKPEIPYEEIEINLEKLKKHPKLYNTLMLKYKDGKSFKELNIDSTKILREARTILTGKYKGVAQVDIETNKIVKCYPSIVNVEEDGFDRTIVSKIINNKKKSREYLGYNWYFVQDIEDKEINMN